MKHGCMVMTLRRSSSLRSGSRQIHRGRKKKRVNFAALSSPCWSFFLSDIRRTVHKGFVPPGQTVNGKFYCEVLKRLREGNRRKRPDKWKNNNWFLHHTKRPLTRLSLFDNSWLPKTLHRFPTPYSPDLAHCDYFLFPKDEITSERASFWHDWRDPRRIARGYRNTHIWELPGMHEIMGNTLGSLYTCPRGLLRRRRWKLGVTVRNFVVKFSEFLGSTSYTKNKLGIKLVFVVRLLLGNSPDSEFYMLTFWNTLLHLNRQVGVKNTYLSMKMEQSDPKCSI